MEKLKHPVTQFFDFLQRLQNVSLVLPYSVIYEKHVLDQTKSKLTQSKETNLILILFYLLIIIFFQMFKIIC